LDNFDFEELNNPDVLEADQEAVSVAT
jgi:hypothetical protein